MNRETHKKEEKEAIKELPRKTTAEPLLDERRINLDEKINLSKKLYDSAERNDLDKVKLLLQEGADPNYAPYKSYIRPLHLAVKNENLEMINLLLQHNADPTLEDYRGLDPLTYAHIRCYEESIVFNITRIILEYLEKEGKIKEARNILNKAFLISVKRLFKSAMKLLIEKGDADINAQDKENKNSPLHLLVDKLIYAIKYYKDKGSNNENYKQTIEEIKNIIKFLLSNGIDTKLKNSDNETVFDLLMKADEQIKSTNEFREVVEIMEIYKF